MGSRDGGPSALQLLGIAQLVSSAGNGLWLAGGVLYLTRSADFAASQVGWALTLGGLIGVLAGVPIGALADRTGARGVTLLTLMLEATGTAAFAAVHTMPQLLAAASVAACGLAGTNAARGTLLTDLFDVAGATRARAVIRAVANLGISVGTVGAGFVLAVDTRSAYLGLVLADAATFVVSAMIVLRLPAHAAADSSSRPAARAGPAAAGRLRAVRDGRYVAVAVLSGISMINYAVLTVALPLWVVTATSAPRWLVAPLFFLSTLLCVVLQIRASRGMDEPARASSAARRAGLLFAGGCLLFALSSHRPAALAVCILVAAVVVHTVGELKQAGASFGLSFALARPGRHGQYQGVWGVGAGVGEAAGPAVMTTVVIGGGVLGWLGIAALLAVCGALTPTAVTWALRGQPHNLLHEAGVS